MDWFGAMQGKEGMRREWRLLTGRSNWVLSNGMSTPAAQERALLSSRGTGHMPAVTRLVVLRRMVACLYNTLLFLASGFGVTGVNWLTNSRTIMHRP